MSKRSAILLFVLFSLVALPAMATPDGAEGGSSLAGLLAPGLTIALAAFGGAMAQGRSVAAACEAMGRNPGSAGHVRFITILGLALIESLVIYALIIAFTLAGKV